MRSELRYRQIHLDFHTSEHIENVGAEFDKDQFVEALKRGHVNSVTVIARCHHGWAYYPSKVCKPHPHLKCNLLGEMVEACRANDINVPIYITVQWDERMARERPEWRVIHAEQDRGASLDQRKPAWRPLCLSNKEYVDYLKAQALEVIEMFKPDGLFFDILLPWQCVCRNCIERMRAAGLDPNKEKDRLENHRSLILEFYKEMTESIHGKDPDMRVFYNSGHIYKGERERWSHFSHLELESLPTGGWGYDHFPVSARYCNTLGMEYLGMTGKFHTTWGEFGGFKQPVALEYEACLMAAMGARCSVGDQLHPLGKMDMATYEEIAPGYARVEMIEEYLPGATPVSEIAILSSEACHRARDAYEHSDIGAARMLLEMQVMFDVIDQQEDFGKYKLLVLPDSITLAGELLDKIRKYLDNSGKLILSGSSGMTPDASAFAIDFKATVSGMSEFSPDYVLASKNLDPNLVESPFVMYERAHQVKAAGAETLAETRVPYFNRTLEHFCGHQHAPFRPERNEAYDAILQDSNIIYFSHPVFLAYYNAGQPLLKYLVRGAVNRLLPERNIHVTMPSSGRVSLMEQKDQNRLLLHLLYAQTQLRGESGFAWTGGRKMEIIEDVVPVYDIPCVVNVTAQPKRIFLADKGENIPFAYKNGRVSFTVNKVYIHELVVIDYS